MAVAEARFVYIAGPYSDKDQEKVSLNIQRADEAAKALTRKGHIPFTPHMMTAGWETDPRVSYEDFLRIDLAWLCKCDWLLFLGHSPGADRELAEARERGMPVFYSVEKVPEVANAEA